MSTQAQAGLSKRAEAALFLLLFTPIMLPSLAFGIDADGNGFDDADEQLIADKFCPSLVLHAGDQGVSPEPVRIVSDRIWVSCFYVDNPAVFAGEGLTYWADTDYSMVDSYLWWTNGTLYLDETTCTDTGFWWRHFPHFDYAGPGPAPHCDEWISGASNDQPGGWYSAYHNGNEWTQPGSAYPHTVYAHMFTSGSGPSTRYAIQYWYFYPFDDWVNNHEGDWEHVNVVISSNDPTSAEIVEVVYYFHQYYYIATLLPGPGVEDFDCYIVDGTHPVVFVGGYGTCSAIGSTGSGNGSHGAYPIMGTWWAVVPQITFEGWGFTPSIADVVDGAGRWIPYSSFIDGDGADDNGVVVIKEPSYYASIGKEEEMSWLISNVVWGTPYVHSFCTHAAIGWNVWGDRFDFHPYVLGNASVPGPAHGRKKLSNPGTEQDNCWHIIDEGVGAADGKEGFGLYPLFTYGLPNNVAYVSDIPWSPPARHVQNASTGLSYWSLTDAVRSPSTLDGHTIVIDGELREEGVTVEKAVHIVGNGVGSLEGFGSGVGIVVAVGGVRVSGVEVSGYDTAILLLGNEAHVDHVTIAGCPSIGVDAAGGANSMIEDCTIEEASIGIVGGPGLTACTVRRNEISEYEVCAIRMDSGSASNTLYGNILWAGAGTIVIDAGSGNHWDGGYPVGGNFWSNHWDEVQGCYDLYQGSAQTSLGHDGIVDAGGDGGLNPVVVLPSQAQDRYPLRNNGDPFGIRIQCYYGGGGDNMCPANGIYLEGVAYKWRAAVSGGVEPYDLKWYYAWDCETDTYAYIGDNNPQLFPTPGSMFCLKLTVMDADGRVGSGQMRVPVKEVPGMEGDLAAAGEGSEEGSSLGGVVENPSTGLVRFRGSLGGRAPIEMSIYSVAGTRVRQLRLEKSASSDSELVADIRDLPSGVYLYELRAGDECRRGKIVLMK